MKHLSHVVWCIMNRNDGNALKYYRENSFEDLQTIHHELGHIQYQQNYKHLPQVIMS